MTCRVTASIRAEIAFVLCYGTGLRGTTGSSAVAFIAGAVPNDALNRFWTRGAGGYGQEVIRYALISLSGFGASALATGWADHLSPRLTNSHASRPRSSSGRIALVVLRPW